MRQGTISVLFGCHSVIHSLLVIISWKKLYKSFPGTMESVCILLHDVGHVGKDYLNNDEQKREHWKLGARIASKIFGIDGYNLVAGHDRYSGYPESRMYKPDKYSWSIAPYWWLWINNIIEPKIRQGMGNREAIIDFQDKVRQSINSGAYIPTHDMYIERRNKCPK